VGSAAGAGDVAFDIPSERMKLAIALANMTTSDIFFICTVGNPEGAE
jgi:hypothetical protein